MPKDFHFQVIISPNICALCEMSLCRKVRRKDISSHLSQSSQLCEEVWLMLGQDANEVLCFVEVKGDFRDKIKEGSSYFLKGLSLAKRQQLSG